MDANKSKVVAVVLRVLLAAVFMVSAVAKLMAIDDFELYVFSYGFFSLNATYILVRLCIAVELLTGLLLALGWWRRWVNLLALAMLLFFSLFLCYAALAGRNESCQCFGRLAEMNPGQSLLKNAVLIVLTLLSLKLSGRFESKAGKNATRVVLTAVLGVAVMVGVFCVSVPDNWMFRSSESRYDQELFEAAIAPDGALEADSLSRGPQLVPDEPREIGIYRQTQPFGHDAVPLLRACRPAGGAVPRHHLRSAAVDYPDGRRAVGGYLPLQKYQRAGNQSHAGAVGNQPSACW